MESHVPDQPVYAPISSLTPSIAIEDDSVQIGDAVDVYEGSHRGERGYVTEVHQLAGTLKFVSSREETSGHQFVVPILVTAFKPDPRVLKYTVERGFDVRPGEDLIIMRGKHRGKRGIVSRVRLEDKSLDIAHHLEPHVSSTVAFHHDR